MRLLEVIACSIEDAVAAERGGAGRLEIVRSLDVGGLTPSVALVRGILGAVSIPVRVMVRENAGFETSGEREIENLCRSAAEFAALRVDGLVLGFLQGRELDLPLIHRILRHAPAVKATFHRAFEHLSDPAAAIAALKTIPQFDRILVSPAAADLARLSQIAAPQLGILAGGGLDRPAIRQLLRTTSLVEFHVGSAARRHEEMSQPVDAAQVRALVDMLAG
jgi:copper homeostasis protein